MQLSKLVKKRENSGKYYSGMFGHPWRKPNEWIEDWSILYAGDDLDGIISTHQLVANDGRLFYHNCQCYVD